LHDIRFMGRFVGRFVGRFMGRLEATEAFFIASRPFMA